jgi:hypothetical protein
MVKMKMGCAIIRTKDDLKMFICGEGVKPNPYRECGYESDFLCDYPVGNGKTCDAQLCWKHAQEVAPGIHYCSAHFDEWKKFKDEGGVIAVLKNVIPFSDRYIK